MCGWKLSFSGLPRSARLCSFQSVGRSRAVPDGRRRLHRARLPARLLRAVQPGADRQLAFVDRALPRDGTASLIQSATHDPTNRAGQRRTARQGLVVWTEFFTSVSTACSTWRATRSGRDNLASPALTVGPGGVVLERGRPFAPSYAVLDSRQPVVGRELARLDLTGLGSTQYQDGASLTLWEVDPPLRFLVTPNRCHRARTAGSADPRRARTPLRGVPAAGEDQAAGFRSCGILLPERGLRRSSSR